MENLDERRTTAPPIEAFNNSTQLVPVAADFCTFTDNLISYEYENVTKLLRFPYLKLITLSFLFS